MSPLLALGVSTTTPTPPSVRTTPHPHIVFYNPHHQQTLAIQHQSVPTALIYYMLLILILLVLIFDVIQLEDVSW